MANKTHAESLFSLLNGKYIQIYLGDSIGKRIYADDDSDIKAIVKGKVVRAEGEWLIILCEFIKQGLIVSKEVFINGWSIKSVMEQEQGIALEKALNLEIQRMLKR